MRRPIKEAARTGQEGTEHEHQGEQGQERRDLQPHRQQGNALAQGARPVDHGAALYWSCWTGVSFAQRAFTMMNLTYRGVTYEVRSEACLLALVAYLQARDADESLAA